MSSLTSIFFKVFSWLIVWTVIIFPALPRASRAPAASDKIHFLRVGIGDAILLESNGHFAMVDAGEDSDNPRGFDALAYSGYEKEVLAYLKAHAADKNGKVHLDFVIGTHAHSDHIGGFDTIILDPDVTVDRAYLKVYDSSKIKESEIKNWDNQEVYDQMVAALKARKVPIISKLNGTPFTFGNFTVTLFNTNDPKTAKKVGENDQSLGVLLEKNGTRVFLAGDMDNLSGDETRLAPEIGKVNLLKLGHHGFNGSTSEEFIKTLRPDACVVTNTRDVDLRQKFSMIMKICGHKKIYVTGIENGVLAVVGDGGKISFYGKIQK